MCELEEAFDKVRSLLPTDWVVAEMSQRADGWHVKVGKWGRDPWAYVESNWWPRLDTKGGTLTKALERMADLLEEHNAQAARV